MRKILNSKTSLRISSLSAIIALGAIGWASFPLTAQPVPSLTHVGDITASMLSEVQFRQQPDGGRWVLADGRTVSGTRYAAITGKQNAPDLRGVYLRGRNFSRDRSTGNADGDLDLGTHQRFQNAAHSHGYTWMKPDNSIDGVDSTAFPSGEHHNEVTNTAVSGGSEARPNSVTINYFIRVN